MSQEQVRTLVATEAMIRSFIGVRLVNDPNKKASLLRFLGLNLTD
jgi:hypothetical protein